MKKQITKKVFPGKDLTQTQVYTTYQTFDKRASEYADNWEWNRNMIKIITKYNIEPFTKFVKPGSTCLIAECQSGRDYSILSEYGLRCIGTSSSYGLLIEAQKRVPNGLFLCSDVRKLPFVPNSFDHIYADALTRIPRRDVKDTIKDLYLFLRTNGYIYLSFRIGKKGMYLQKDIVGKRYMTIFNKSDILKIINSTGLHIVWSTTSKHLETTLPDWFSLVAQKIK